MRIAHIHAAFWPYVRRGAERLVYELANELARRDHAVDILTTRPGRDQTTQFGKVRVIYQKQVRHPLFQHWRSGYAFAYFFGLTVLPILLRERYDILHCWWYQYAPAAWLSAKRSGGRYLYHNMVPNWHFPYALDQAWFRRAVRQADGVADLSHHSAARLHEFAGVPVRTIPPPVNLAEFQLKETRDLRRPRILFASSLTDPRKGLALLLRAFNIVHRRCPQAILHLAGPAELAGADPQAALAWIWQLLDQEAHASVELSGVGTLHDLPGLYQAAAVTVLPSIEEPFGMVLIESLACGTPVVATASSGPRDIVTPEVGRLVAEVPDLQAFFDDQRAQELADALLATIELAGTPGTAAACRARAANWDVQVIGTQVEQWYREVHI